MKLVLPSKPVLQVALDLTCLGRATALATDLSRGIGCNKLLIEAGTPLIKSWGVLAVSLLNEVTKCMVVADTKTMDTGALEAELMLKNGASIVTVLGVADDYTIRDAINKASDLGGYVAVDLINHPDPLNRAMYLVGKLGVDVIIYHIGIDVQVSRKKTAIDLLKEVEEIKKEYPGVAIAVAGGIKPPQVPGLVRAGADIIIVGSYITKSRDPVKAAKDIINKFQG